MPQRDIKNYGSSQLQTQTILTYFQMTDNALRFKLDTWLTVDAFQNDEPPFTPLSDAFAIEGAQFEGVKTEHRETFNLVQRRVEELGEITDGIIISDWSIDAIKRIFTINRKNESKSTLEPKVFTDGFQDGFTAQMQAEENLALRQMIGFFCLSFAASLKRPNQRIYQTILEGLQG